MNEVKKLIRLHSNESTGLFECQFAEEILIDKNSEMSLHSTTFRILNGTLNVTTGDIGKIQVTIVEPDSGDRIEFEIQIAPFEYTKLDVKDLLFELNDETNKAISDYVEVDESSVGARGNYESFIRGRQALWDINKEGKIRFRIKGQFPIKLSLAVENRYKNMVFANGYFAKSDGVVSNNINQNYSYSKLKFIKCSGVARAQIFNFSNTGDASANFMGIGLTTRDDLLKDGTITLEDLDVAVYTGNTVTDNYRTRTINRTTKISEEVVSNVAPSKFVTGTKDDNDVLQIELIEGRLYFIIHKDNGVINIIGDADGYSYKFQDELFFVCFINGVVANCRLHDVRYNIDPYQKIHDSFEGEIIANTLGSISTPSPAGNDPTISTEYEMDFITIELADFLGYSSVIYQDPGIYTVRVFDLVAEDVFRHISHANSYVIELLNIQLDSYDSFTNNGGRRNILSVIPVTDVILDSTSGIVRYEPHTPSYISLKNKDRQIGIRNITLRILTQDMQPIQTDGLNFITVLIKSISNT